MQEIQGSRLSEYEGSRKRLGITREMVYLQQAPPREIVIVHLEVDVPEEVFAKLVASAFPFDRWLKRQILEIHGLDLSQPLFAVPKELVFTWQVS